MRLMSPRQVMVSTVAVQDSDRSSGSLGCLAWPDTADAGDPIAGWPLVELPPRLPVASRPLHRVPARGTRSRPSVEKRGQL